MRYAYPFNQEPQPEGGFTITFPDLPEAISEADNDDQAQCQAEQALVTALSFYTDEARPFPVPSPAHGRPLAHPPPLVAAKLALHDAMLAASLSNSALARRLGMDEKAVRRLRDPLHRSHIGQIEAALRILGKRLEVRVLECA